MKNFEKTNKEKFKDDGFCIFRKVFTNAEIKKYKDEIIISLREKEITAIIDKNVKVV